MGFESYHCGKFTLDHCGKMRKSFYMQKFVVQQLYFFSSPCVPTEIANCDCSFFTGNGNISKHSNKLRPKMKTQILKLLWSRNKTKRASRIEIERRSFDGGLTIIQLYQNQYHTNFSHEVWIQNYLISK